jgi:hypothetical protein
LNRLYHFPCGTSGSDASQLCSLSKSAIKIRPSRNRVVVQFEIRGAARPLIRASGELNRFAVRRSDARLGLSGRLRDHREPGSPPPTTGGSPATGALRYHQGSEGFSANHRPTRHPAPTRSAHFLIQTPISNRPAKPWGLVHCPVSSPCGPSSGPLSAHLYGRKPMKPVSVN